MTAYPRWDGPLRGGSLFGVVAAREVKRAFTNFWSRLALTFIAAYTVVYLGSLYTLQQSRGDAVHTMQNFLDFLNNLRWGALGVAAVLSGPSLLEDTRRGALDLYLTRSVTMVDYLVGKIVAIFSLSALSLIVPAIIYYAASFFFFKKQPDGWSTALPGAVLYAVILALLVSGLGLGLSCISRSSRAATLLLFGTFALLDLVISNVLEGITRDPKLQILSPFAAFQQQSEWIFKGVDSGAEFPLWWGVTELAVLIIVGWALVAWRHPRPRGEDRVRA